MTIAAIASLLLTAAMIMAFLGGLSYGVAALIVLRPVCDRLFEQARFTVAGHDLSCGAVLNLIVIAAMLASLGRLTNKIQITLERSWIPFLLVALFAVSYSPVAVDASRKFLTYVSYMAMFVLPFAIVKMRSTAEWLFKVVIASSVIPVLYGLFQLVSGIDWYQGSRIASTFTHPNIFAFYLLAVIGLILTMLCTNRVHLTERARTLLSMYLLPMLVLLIMTKTRSAWICGLLLFLTYGALQDKRVLLLALLMPVLALAVPGVRERLTALATGNQYVGWVETVNPYAWRTILWTRAVPLILEQPLFGHGLYSFPYYSPKFFPLESSRGVDAHNVFIQLLFETGVAGLGAFLWMFLRQFSWLFRYWAFDRRGITMAGVALSIYLITCYSDNLLEYVSFGWCYWFSAGLIFAELSQSRAGVLATPAPLRPMEAHVRNA